MISDNQGNVRFLIHPPQIASLFPAENYFHITINDTAHYGVPFEGLKEICFDTSQPRQVVLSPHIERLNQIFADLGVEKGVLVDIGAHDGLNYSHSRALLEKGWGGLLAECEPFRFACLADIYRLFASVSLARSKVTPFNVLPLLEAAEIPMQFDFLSLDIDSYDYFVLEKILTKYHPTVICAEVNEAIPPPIRFAVKYSPDFELDLAQRFYGMSIAALADLAQRHGYGLLYMHYMDVFLIDLNFIEGSQDALTDFYRRYFLDLPRPDYYHFYPFDTETVFQSPPEEALRLIQTGFQAFEGQYLLSLNPF